MGLRRTVLPEEKGFKESFSLNQLLDVLNSRSGQALAPVSLPHPRCQNDKSNATMDTAGLTVPEEARYSCIIQSFVFIMHGLD